MRHITRKILTTAILIPALATSIRGADVLVDWTFENPAVFPLGNGTTTGTNVTGTSPGTFVADSGVNATGSIATGFHASSSTVWSGPVGNGSSKSLSSTNWAVGDYYQFQLSTTGYDTINLIWDQVGSNTGPKDFQVSYSTDGSAFTPFSTYVVPVSNWSGGTPNGAGTGFTADLSAITLLQNAATVFIRLIDNSTTSINGSTVAAGGTGRVDNFVVTGSAFIPSVDRFWDGNAGTAGVGGSGIWTSASTTWNTLADGTGTVAALGAGEKAIFGTSGGTVTVTGTVTASAGIKFATGGYTLGGAGTISLTATANRIEVTNAPDTATINTILAGTTGLEKTGAGTLVLGGNNTYTGGTKIALGTLQITNDSSLGDAAGAIVLNGGTLKTTANVTLNSSRALSGAGTVDIAPASTLTVSGDVTAGLLTLANSGALMLSGTTQSIGGLVFMQAGTITSANAPTFQINGNITTNNTTGTVVIDASPAFDTGHTIAVARGNAAVDLRITGGVGGGFTVTKTGDGIMELLGDISGLTGQFRLGVNAATATPGGTTIVHSDTALGTKQFLFNNGTIRNVSGGLLNFANAVSIGGGQLTGGAVIEGNDVRFQGAITVFDNNSAPNFTQRLTANTTVILSGGVNDATPLTDQGHSQGLAFSGTGRVVLTNTTNAISLPLIVDGGKLTVNGGLTATVLPTITVQNGGELSGNMLDLSTTVGPVVVNGGTLSPGTLADSFGTAEDLTGAFVTKDLTIAAGGTYKVDLAGTAAGLFDQVTVNGAVTLGGFIDITLLSGFIPAQNTSFTILLNDGLDPVSGTFLGAANNQVFFNNGRPYRINYGGGDGNDVVLTFVPEPATAGLLLLGGLGLASRRRRKA